MYYYYPIARRFLHEEVPGHDQQRSDVSETDFALRERENHFFNKERSPSNSTSRISATTTSTITMEQLLVDEDHHHQELSLEDERNTKTNQLYRMDHLNNFYDRMVKSATACSERESFFSSQPATSDGTTTTIATGSEGTSNKMVVSSSSSSMTDLLFFDEPHHVDARRYDDEVVLVSLIRGQRTEKICGK
jgi:hypothetical protein